jgi:hypothetical protein
VADQLKRFGVIFLVVHLPNHRSLHSHRSLRAAKVFRYRRTEFANHHAHLAVILKSAKAGAQETDSFIGVRGHKTPVTSAISLAGCWPGQIVQVNGRRRGR